MSRCYNKCEIYGKVIRKPQAAKSSDSVESNVPDSYPERLVPFINRAIVVPARLACYNLFKGHKISLYVLLMPKAIGKAFDSTPFFT